MAVRCRNARRRRSSSVKKAAPLATCNLRFSCDPPSCIIGEDRKVGDKVQKKIMLQIKYVRLKIDASVTRKEMEKCKIKSRPPHLMRFISTNLDISYRIKIRDRSYRADHKAFSQRTVKTHDNARKSVPNA